jgi:multicomponent Na+:H+ antiporter subunit C
VNVVLVLALASLTAAGVYLLLDRSLIRIVLGLALLGHMTVLLLQVSGGATGVAPLIGDAGTGDVSDPLPQALALTAIVITFGVTAFLLALAVRAFVLSGSDQVPDDLEDRRVARTRGSVDHAGTPGVAGDTGGRVRISPGPHDDAFGEGLPADAGATSNGADTDGRSS